MNFICIFVSLNKNKMTTIEKIRNYEGQNQFLQNLKMSLKQWGRLTDKQLSAAERVLRGSHEVNVETLPAQLKKIVEYVGTHELVVDVKNKFLKYGTLSEKQISVANKIIINESEKKVIFRHPIRIEDNTIKVSRAIGYKLARNHNLQFLPLFIDTQYFLGMKGNALHIRGKLTSKIMNVCSLCGRALTDEFSILTGYGKTCAKHLGVEYVKDKNDVSRFKTEIKQKIDEIGYLDFWIHKNSIKGWEGFDKYILQDFF